MMLRELVKSDALSLLSMLKSEEVASSSRRRRRRPMASTCYRVAQREREAATSSRSGWFPKAANMR